MSGQGKLLVRVLSWLRAIDDRVAISRQAPEAARLIDVDSRTAIQISRFVIDEDLSFFISKRDLSARLGCAKSTAEASLVRLELAGFLRAVTPPARLSGRRRGVGRSAKCFRIASFSPDQPGKTKAHKTPGQPGETIGISPGSPGKIQAVISPDPSGGFSPDPSGPIREEEKEEQSRSRSDGIPASEWGRDFDADVSIDEGGLNARPSARATP